MQEMLLSKTFFVLGLQFMIYGNSNYLYSVTLVSETKFLFWYQDFTMIGLIYAILNNNVYDLFCSEIKRVVEMNIISLLWLIKKVPISYHKLIFLLNHLFCHFTILIDLNAL